MGLIANAAANLGRQAQAIGSAISSGAGDVVDSFARRAVKNKREKLAGQKEIEDAEFQEKKREQGLQDKERIIQAKSKANIMETQKKEAARRKTILARQQGQKPKDGETSDQSNEEEFTLNPEEPQQVDIRSERIRRYQQMAQRNAYQNLRQAQGIGGITQQEPYMTVPFQKEEEVEEDGISYGANPEEQVDKFEDATQVQQAENQLQASLGVSGLVQAGAEGLEVQKDENGEELALQKVIDENDDGVVTDNELSQVDENDNGIVSKAEVKKAKNKEKAQANFISSLTEEQKKIFEGLYGGEQ